MAGLTRRGKYWYATWYDEQGRKRFKSLKTPRVTEARERLAKLFSDDIPPGYVRDMTIKDATAALESFMAASFTQSTQRTYLMHWRALIEDVAPKTVKDITEQRIRQHLRQRRQGGDAPNTSRTRTLNIKSIMGCLTKTIDTPIAMPNPAAGIALPKGEKKLPRWLTDTELAKLLVEADKYDEERRDRDNSMLMVVALGALAGLRRGEIAAAKVGWIHWSAGCIVVSHDAQFRTKSQKERTVPISPSLHHILARVVQSKDAAQYLVRPHKKGAQDGARYRVDWDAQLRQIYKRAGIEGASTHTLRHTFASHLAMGGVSLYKISKWLGHANVQTTEIYAHLAPDYDEDIARGFKGVELSYSVGGLSLSHDQA